jgi:hypothetical protein
MNRAVIPLMGVALAAMISTSAHAVTGKWCFKWGIDFDDNDMGEDYVKTTRPARF